MATQQYLLQQLAKAVALMAHRLNDHGVASLTELAAAAAISPFHFHRVYRLLLGETCQQTLQRLQLAKAGQALAAAAPVTEAALMAGYSSSQALAKALKRELSINATALRADPDRLAALLGELAAPRELSVAGGQAVSPYQVSVVHLAPAVVLAITSRGQYPDLYEVYGELFGLLADVGQVRAILGLAFDDVDADLADVRFDAALLLADAVPALSATSGSLPAPAHWQQVAEQQYLVLRHLGSYQLLPAAIDYLYARALSEPGCQLADAPCLHHYLDDPEQTPEAQLRTDIYLPILPG